MDAPVWDVTVFTKNRDRFLAGEVAPAFFEQVLAQTRAQRLLSNEHFTVDGTLIEAWADQKSFTKKAEAPLMSLRKEDDPSPGFSTPRRSVDWASRQAGGQRSPSIKLIPRRDHRLFLAKALRRHLLVERLVSDKRLIIGSV